MHETKVDCSDPGTVDRLSWLISSMEKLTRKISGLEKFKLENKEKQQFLSFLKQVEPENLKNYLQDEDLLLKQEAMIELMQAGAVFINESKHYRLEKEEQKRQQFLEECRINNIPLSMVKDLPEVALTPADCGALHDWPEHRQFANGKSGRLENAGQFMKRLLDEKLYDKAVYGELFMSDLKHINPSLYQALAKWQSRNETRLLKTKREEIDQLLNNQEGVLTFQQASQVRNARWRRHTQAKVPSP